MLNKQNTMSYETITIANRLLCLDWEQQIFEKRWLFADVWNTFLVWIHCNEKPEKSENCPRNHKTHNSDADYTTPVHVDNCVKQVGYVICT